MWRTEKLPMSEDEKGKIGRREALKLAGLGLIGLGAGKVGYDLWKSKQEESETAELIEGSTVGFNNEEVQNLPEETMRSGTLATPTPQTEKPESTPEAKEAVEHFILGETIDLADHTKPLVMAIRTNSDKWLVTPHGFPYPFSEEVEEKGIFDNPENKAVETYIGDGGPYTWAHAGIYEGNLLFAGNLERFIRNPSGITISLEDEDGKTYQKRLTGETATPQIAKEVFKQHLLGARVYLFQGVNEGSFPPGFPAGMNLEEDFEGNILELEIEAGARIPRFETDENQEQIDMVRRYSQNVLNTSQWVNENYPNTGFDKNRNWYLKFCSGRLSYEPPVPDYIDNSLVYGRYLMGFDIPQNALRKRTFKPRGFES